MTGRGGFSGLLGPFLIIISNLMCMLLLYHRTPIAPTTHAPDLLSRQSFRTTGDTPQPTAIQTDAIAQAVAQKLAPTLNQISQSVLSSAQVPAAAPVQAAPAAVPAAAPVQAAPVTSVSTSRDVVMGLAKGIDFQNLYQFVSSLRQTSSDIDIVIFTDATPPQHKQIYKTFRVTVSLYKEADLPGGSGKYHPSSYRWILIRDYLERLEKAGTPYDRVMFTDVRDTIFQLNPFPFMKESGFYAFLEAEPKTIRQCGWNSGWVKDCFGSAVLQKIGGNIISCSGTSMASWDAGKEYVELLSSEIYGNKCERNGVDQGMHNVFVHRGQLSNLHIISNEEGWIATVQSMPTVTRDTFGNVLNSNGKVVAVVHQWDRSPQLTRQYAAQFPNIPANLRNKK